MAYTYDHVKTQLDSNLGYEYGKFNDNVGEPEHVPKETNPSTNAPFDRAFTPADTKTSRKLSDDNQHARVIPEGSLVQEEPVTPEPKCGFIQSSSAE